MVNDPGNSSVLRTIQPIPVSGVIRTIISVTRTLLSAKCISMPALWIPSTLMLGSGIGVVNVSIRMSVGVNSVGVFPNIVCVPQSCLSRNPNSVSIFSIPSV